MVTFVLTCQLSEVAVILEEGWLSEFIQFCKLGLLPLGVSYSLLLTSDNGFSGYVYWQK